MPRNLKTNHTQVKTNLRLFTRDVGRVKEGHSTNQRKRHQFLVLIKCRCGIKSLLLLDLDDCKSNFKPGQSAYSTMPHTRHSKSMEHLIHGTAHDQALTLQLSYPPTNYCNPRIYPAQYTYYKPQLQSEFFKSQISDNATVYGYPIVPGYVNTLPLPIPRNARSYNKLERWVVLHIEFQ